MHEHESAKERVIRLLKEHLPPEGKRERREEFGSAGNFTIAGNAVFVFQCPLFRGRPENGTPKRGNLLRPLQHLQRDAANDE